MSSDDTLSPRIARLRSLLFSIAAGEDRRVAELEPGNDEFGKLELTLTTFMTEFIDGRRRTRELEARNAAIIAAQAELIDALAAPIIEVTRDVVVMPFIGPLTHARLGKTTELLLERITRARVQVAIVDLSGVEGVDTTLVMQLDGLFRAVKLLGTQAIVTGIRPELAVTLASLGVEFDAPTARTLRDGLRMCI
jgi:rsbT co-antagonist protein RsbR